MEFNEIIDSFSNHIQRDGLCKGLNKNYLCNRYYLYLNPQQFSKLSSSFEELRKNCFEQYKNYGKLMNNFFITPGATFWIKKEQENKNTKIWKSFLVGPSESFLIGNFSIKDSNIKYRLVVAGEFYPEMVWDLLPEDEPSWEKIQIINNSCKVVGSITKFSQINKTISFELKKGIWVTFASKDNSIIKCPSEINIVNNLLQNLTIHANIDRKSFYYYDMTRECLIKWEPGKEVSGITLNSIEHY